MQGVGQLGGRAEHVLGVVEDHQQVAVADRVDQGVEHGPSRLLADLEHGGHGAGHQFGFGHRRQLDQPHPVAGAIQRLGRHLQRQPGLADPARARDRDQPRPARHQRPQLGQLGGPAHETGRLRRQVVAQRRVVQRAQHGRTPRPGPARSPGIPARRDPGPSGDARPDPGARSRRAAGRPAARTPPRTPGPDHHGRRQAAGRPGSPPDRRSRRPAPRRPPNATPCVPGWAGRTPRARHRQPAG